ncbi:methyltransferase domain-containing protein [Kitasatospora sp. NPDC085895]|uniref:class I SAM-dependent methyltransferase n=1 Tax=Kitasatospora sp. NPDC085895 TaxID=3155057 RepID=UPI00344DA069
MLDYDGEAATYDATRGGEERAGAAAAAVERLLPPAAALVVDVACGTGIVTARLRRPGRTVLGVDRSGGMAAVAAGRLPGRVVLGDAGRLPLAGGRADAVVLVWLLHLLPDAGPVLAEAARVLRPGGVVITTVDKNAAAFGTDSDVARLTAPLREAHGRTPADGHRTVLEAGGRHGLRPTAETGFDGTGQGRSPADWRRAVEAGRIPWATAAGPDGSARLCRDLAALPDQDRPRPQPRYRLLALQRG